MNAYKNREQGSEKTKKKNDNIKISDVHIQMCAPSFFKKAVIDESGHGAYEIFQGTTHLFGKNYI